ncbi:MAG: PDZ domain-containing protein, partial [Pirellulaceae bacterium]
NIYRETWTRLARGESWGYIPGRRPFIGVEGHSQATDARIARVFPNSPAAKGGLRDGDVVLRFGTEDVTDFASLQRGVEQCDPGDKVRVLVRRGEATVELVIQIGRKAD